MGFRLSKIYTRTGDKGETGLGDGRRVPKDHPRIEAIGEVDTLNSQVGLLLAGLIAHSASQPGLNELEDQIRAYAKGEPLEVKAFQHQLMYNLIPHIDKFNEENWYTLEELKMLNESRKMLHHPTLKLSCTCVRVPIARAHSESLNLELENDITPAEAREILSKCEGVRVVDDPLNGGYPMPLDATAKYDVLAGRIRQDISRDDRKGLEMFVSGDQLLRGAALNAVEIAEHLVKRNLV